MSSERPIFEYLLRGRIAGSDRTFGLPRGRTSVGSLPENAIVLPVKGVSRRHAFLVVEQKGVVLTDLDSKNGTWINDRRIRAEELTPGDVVRIGPVALEFVEVPSGDDRLALSFETPSDAKPPRAGTAGDETTLEVGSPARGRPTDPLALVGSLLDNLVQRRHVGTALKVLSAELGWSAAVLAKWTGLGEPLLLAICGDVGDLVSRQPLRELAYAAYKELDDEEVAVRKAELDGASYQLVLRFSSGALWGLALRGELEPPYEPVVVQFMSIAQLLADDEDGRRPTRRRAAPPELVLPDDYVSLPSSVMAELHHEMASLAGTDLPVLIHGETGVGKEFVARILHVSSRRADQPFVAINCAAIPSELLEAEMFGVGKNVATGVAERTGRFQQADGGSLFLDEIGELHVALQAKLLRALQEKEVQTVGGRPTPVDVRILAATNADLARQIREGEFRVDLYYRLAGYVLRVPSLRERTEDVAVLVEELIRRFADGEGKTIRGVTVEALDRLVTYPWPGNIRELEHELQRLVHVCADGGLVDSTMLAPRLRPGVGVSVASPMPVPPSSLDLQARVDAAEREVIQQALRYTEGNQTRAARLLGISRNGLSMKMERLGLED